MSALNVSREEAEATLDEHRSEGQELLQAAHHVQSEPDYRGWQGDRHRWTSLTDAALKYVYGGKDEQQEFNQCFVHMIAFAGTSWADDLRSDHRDLEDAVNKLLSFKERLRYATEPRSAQSLVARDTPKTGELAVFLVHGRADGTRETVARFLELAGAGKPRPIILDELANKGRTLIEKLEEHAADSRYAVVLLTGDDFGGLDRDELKQRARQNVILELGWFCGAIGRKNVAVLYEDGVELPSDIDGLAYIPLAANWKEQLVRELNDSGWDFKLDRLHA